MRYPTEHWWLIAIVMPNGALVDWRQVKGAWGVPTAARKLVKRWSVWEDIGDRTYELCLGRGRVALKYNGGEVVAVELKGKLKSEDNVKALLIDPLS